MFLRMGEVVDVGANIVGNPIYTHFSASQVSTARARKDTLPWSNYASDWEADVITARSAPLKSVIDDGSLGSNLRQHGTENPYSTDGVYDPNAKRADYETVAFPLGWRTSALAMDWQINRNETSAQKCVQMIYNQLADPVKSMDTRAKAFGSWSRNIEIYNNHCAIFRSIGLVWDWGGWTSTQRSQVMASLSNFITTHRQANVGSKGNIDIWRGATRATAALLVGNSTAANEEWNRYQTNINNYVRTDGLLVEEIGRTRGIFYHMYALSAISLLFRTADIGGGPNLWTYGGSRSIDHVFDTMASVLDTSNPVAAWENLGTSLGLNLQEIATTGPIGKSTVLIDSFEFAYNQYHKAAYRSVIERYGRPLPGKYSTDYLTYFIGEAF